MSNLLQNGDFTIPSISANSVKYVQNFTVGQYAQFIWTENSHNGLVALLNGDDSLSMFSGIFSYPDCSNVSVSGNFVSIEMDGGISQTVNITQTGTYALSFQYAVSVGSALNNIQIFFNGIQIDTITTVPSGNNWNTIYANNFNITSTGSFVLLFQGQADITDPYTLTFQTGITNVSLTYALPLTPATPPAPPLSTNLITNGTFSYPQLASNSFLSGEKFTTGQLQGWTTLKLSNTVLVKGTTSFGFPSTTTQYIVLLGVSPYINQNITVPVGGLYLLTFSYASSLKYLSGGIFINIGSKLITTLQFTNTTTGWSTFSYQIPLTAGSYTISINGGGSNTYISVAGQGIALTNLSLILQSGATDLSMNIFNKSSVYGKFAVQPKYSTYDINGNPSGSVIDSGDSTFYGNMTTCGQTNLLGGLSDINITSLISGNCGIGTTTPTYALDVSGTLRATGNIISGNLTVYNSFVIGGNISTNNILINGSGTVNGNLNVGGSLNITQYTIFNNDIDCSACNLYAQNIGVNTKTPAYEIDCCGGIHAIDLYIDEWIGIKTQMPEYPLDVSGEIQTNSNIRMPNTGIIYAKNLSGTYLPIFFPCWSDNITYLNYGAAGMNIRNSNSANTIFLNNSNQVGIKTTTPAYPLHVNGIVYTNNSIQSPKYDLSYTAVPTLTNVSHGYKNTASYTTLPLTPASSSAYAITFTLLPIGVYLIQAYAIGTFITTAITNIKLGLSTSATTLTANNFTQQILPVLSTTQVQSISYNFYLSNTAATTYYIVFATGASFGTSSLTGFTASFIRIA